MKPHKHAELIKAWADGAVIERKYASVYSDFNWEVSHWPTWDENCEYRISNNITLYTCVYPWKDAIATSTAAPNIRLVFDKQNGKLISADVLNKGK